MSMRNALRLVSLLTVVVLGVTIVLADSPEAAQAKGRVEASCQRCGDGYCAPRCENENTCPADCRSTKLFAPAVLEPVPAVNAAPAVNATPVPEALPVARCGRCGDGQCVASCGETAQNCPIDCGTPSTGRTSASAGEARCDAPATEETEERRAEEVTAARRGALASRLELPERGRRAVSPRSVLVG